MKEKLIKGFPGYAVRKDGTVLSYWKNHGHKSYISNLFPITIKPYHSKGYLTVQLVKNRKAYTRLVHRLIAEAYIPNPLKLPLVLHGDDVRINNDLSNLRWGTRSDNRNDYVLNTQVKKGIEHYNAKLTKAQVKEIRKQYAGGKILQRELAVKYGVSPTNIHKIVNYKKWKWL